MIRLIKTFVPLGIFVMVALFCVNPLQAQDLQQEMQQLRQQLQSSNQEMEQSFQQFTSQCEAWGGHTTYEMDGQTHCVGIRGEPDCDIAWSGVNAGPNADCKLPPPDSSSAENSGSANDPYVAMAQDYVQLSEELGTMIGQQIRQSIQQAQAKRQYQQQQEALAALRRLHDQQAAEEKWSEDIHDLYKKMKGPVVGEGDLVFQGGGTPHFKPLSADAVTAPVGGPLEQLQVANCLSKMAAEPGRSPEDAKYLSEQAATAMHGEPVSVNISGCNSAAAPVPVPSAAPVSASLTRDQTALYVSLFNTTTRYTKQADQLVNHAVQLQKAIAQDKKNIEAKQQIVDQLKSAPPQPSVSSGQTPPAQSDAMAEAEAALQQAQQAGTNDQDALTQAQGQLQNLNQKLQQTQSCFQQAQKDPSKSAGLMKTCGQ